MKDKDIKKLLKTEGDQIAPSSFTSLRERLFKSDKYLASKINKEGDQFVPDDYQSVKENIPEEENAKHSLNNGWKIGLTSALAACAVVAIVVPITINVQQPLTADATCDIKLEEESQDESENICELTCELSKNGNIKENTLFPKNDVAKKLLAGVKAKEYEVSLRSVSEFLDDILTFGFETKDKNDDYIFDNDCVYKVTISTYGEGSYKIDHINKILEDIASGTNLMTPEGKIHAIDINKKDDIPNKLSAIQYDVDYLFNRLFVRNSTVIHDFISKNTFDTSTLENAKESLQTLRNIYSNIALDSDIEKFQDDLINLHNENNKDFDEIDYQADYASKSYWNKDYWTNYWTK